LDFRWRVALKMLPEGPKGICNYGASKSEEVSPSRTLPGREFTIDITQFVKRIGCKSEKLSLKEVP